MQLSLIQLYTPTSFARLIYSVKKTEKAPQWLQVWDLNLQFINV